MYWKEYQKLKSSFGPLEYEEEETLFDMFVGSKIRESRPALNGGKKQRSPTKINDGPTYQVLVMRFFIEHSDGWFSVSQVHEATNISRSNINNAITYYRLTPHEYLERKTDGNHYFYRATPKLIQEATKFAGHSFIRTSMEVR